MSSYICFRFRLLIATDLPPTCLPVLNAQIPPVKPGVKKHFRMKREDCRLPCHTRPNSSAWQAWDMMNSLAEPPSSVSSPFNDNKEMNRGWKLCLAGLSPFPSGTVSCCRATCTLLTTPYGRMHKMRWQQRVCSLEICLTSSSCSSTTTTFLWELLLCHGANYFWMLLTFKTHFLKIKIVVEERHPLHRNPRSVGTGWTPSADHSSCGVDGPP